MSGQFCGENKVFYKETLLVSCKSWKKLVLRFQPTKRWVKGAIGKHMKHAMISLDM